jgi:predicted nucleic acid-binding Zn ribbon protein
MNKSGKQQFKLKCQVCGKEITATRFWAKYCSSTCRQIAWALKEREKQK